ncbi:PBSX family phage terminase large subunit [Clostridium pasteurianum]|uniref:Phage terminase, large subunit, PBSX family n=1 Tax=Clostridium pasteurianum BC1 TaxID=86416 RepID=R4K123_CLOPA|nr:PBSX family phage terminase large subunit [Clostridium pasteurianum]AGK96792.1 phage terminase, large subunit, PBSX family [Clostridium pasteurianum BC1]
MPQPINITISSKIFNKAYMPYLQDYEHRFNVFYGGSGSGKSHFVIQKMILKYLKFPNRKCLVIRKVGATLRDSVFALFKSVLSDWHIYDKCTIKESFFTIELPNGNQFIFKGLDDSEKIKSIANIDDIIIEECTELNLDEFSQLNLRLRSKNKFNQIYCMFNPVSKANWTYIKWFENGYNHDNTVVVHTTYKDNKFLPKEYVNSLLEMEKDNPTYYRIYALGQFATLDKLVYNNWKIDNFDWKELIKNNNKLTAYFGMDFGYVNDPSAFVAILVDKEAKKMYIFDEFYRKGLLNNELAKMIKSKGYSKEIIIADSAEQKSIEEIKRDGIYRIKGARKGKDSIINGIQFIQQYQLIINTNCTNIVEELSNYTWQKDKSTGEYINRPIDKYNHLLDALRYSCEDLNKNKVRVRFL